jgi:hypothetical protein
MRRAPADEWNFPVFRTFRLLLHGAIAQLGERLNGIQEVVGSIPSGSTNPTYFMMKTAAGTAAVFVRLYFFEPAAD